MPISTAPLFNLKPCRLHLHVTLASISQATWSLRDSHIAPCIFESLSHRHIHLNHPSSHTDIEQVYHSSHASLFYNFRSIYPRHKLAPIYSSFLPAMSYAERTLCPWFVTSYTWTSCHRSKPYGFWNTPNCDSLSPSIELQVTFNVGFSLCSDCPYKQILSKVQSRITVNSAPSVMYSCIPHFIKVSAVFTCPRH